MLSKSRSVSEALSLQNNQDGIELSTSKAENRQREEEQSKRLRVSTQQVIWGLNNCRRILSEKIGSQVRVAS